ncbi:choline ABC transporter substrate-binding protein [Falsirhodobacter xinxiangensis]|uniref:choline ABC transporter substrate-binding protein n=1 Tax=Falsirhodobacter xinxiangensis TaxID=2530049 RepID=UPI0010AA7A1A|nr:choline ABC transporter substrate-binding protein [Rhodobacter xinxiangensis]
MTKIIPLLGIAMLAAVPAIAQDDASCRTIRSFDPGWTDITATNAVASVVLDALGYDLQISTLSVPVGYAALKDDQIDAFLGNWMPAQSAFIADLEGKIDTLGRNLEGAKFTLAVPAETAALGIASLADLDAHADAFGRKIYGIEPGAPANQNILKIIEADDYGLGDWEIVESSEQAMLAEVQRQTRSGTPVVFLAWAPHPMNNQIDIEYLEGADAYFGPNFGGAEVNTIARKEWVAACPNAAAAFKGLVFDLPLENELMGKILEGEDAQAAATKWIEANPERLDAWLAGVTTLDGQPGLEAVKAELDL